MAVRCSARSYIHSRRVERAFGGGDRHELVRVVLRCVAVPAIDAHVARVIVFIKLSCDAREAHGGRRVGEAGGPAAAREMGRPPLKKQRDGTQQRGRRMTSASQQAKDIVLASKRRVSGHGIHAVVAWSVVLP